MKRDGNGNKIDDIDEVRLTYKKLNNEPRRKTDAVKED